MILQDTIPYDVFAGPRLPGVAPLDEATWLQADEAYPAQMAERRRLLAERPEAVHALLPGALEAACETLDNVLGALRAMPGFTVGPDTVTGPDGITTPVDRAAPLMTLGRIVQEDINLMIRPEGAAEHVLGGSVLCFPASWRLDEKIGRPLTAIHAPVAEYPEIAARVQRLFDGVQVGRPLWRFNVLWYDDPTLFQPRSRLTPRPLSDPTGAAFLRSERQCILRLPRTRAVVFSLHTYVVAADRVRGPAPTP
jgi:hypothetical protein